MEIAEHVDEFAKADPREAYLERAKFLAPDDPELWYRCGTLELADGRPDRAWASWRRSLELSDGHLPEILDRSAALLSPHDILRRVLPDRPDLLLKAALHLYPEPGEGRRPFLERALAILEERTDASGASGPASQGVDPSGPRPAGRGPGGVPERPWTGSRSSSPGATSSPSCCTSRASSGNRSRNCSRS